jgi:hypothetical protein
MNNEYLPTVDETKAQEIAEQISDAIKPLVPSCIPTKLFTRNEYGLICDNSIKYIFNDDGTINWRKMIKPEFLVPNKQIFERKGLPIPTSVEGLTDGEVLILLGGIKELAQTRGYAGVEYKVETPNKDYVVAVCKITWIPNYESNNQHVVFSAIGDAHEGNTTSFGRQFLGPIAENRAFCRTVRNFLKIHIVSQEEMGGTSETIVEDVATVLLRETMLKFSISFEKIKEKLIKDGVENAEKFFNISDIPRFKQFELIERIKKKAAERGIQPKE